MRNSQISQIITDRKDASLASYFKDVSKLSLISQEEEIKLAKRIKKGDKDAENELVKANLRFVISIAKQYQGKGLDLVDLIQEGNLGILEASRKFNPDRGYKFISYAVWWIRQAIMKAISNQCRLVRVPMNRIAGMSKINKVTEKYEQQNGYKPPIDEIEEQTDLDTKKINLSYASTYRSVSLDSPLADTDEASSLIDVIPNQNVEDIDNSLNKEDLVNEIDEVLRKLPYRESDTLRMTFGIGVQQMSSSEIAQRFCIGNERVRQIQINALGRIRDKYGDKLISLL